MPDDRLTPPHVKPPASDPVDDDRERDIREFCDALYSLSPLDAARAERDELRKLADDRAREMLVECQKVMRLQDELSRLRETQGLLLKAAKAIEAMLLTEEVKVVYTGRDAAGRETWLRPASENEKMRRLMALTDAIAAAEEDA